MEQLTRHEPRFGEGSRAYASEEHAEVAAGLEFRRLAGRLPHLMASCAQDLRRTAAGIAQQSRDAWGRVTVLSAQLREQIRQQPERALILAVAMGFLLGLVLRRTLLLSRQEVRRD